MSFGSFASKVYLSRAQTRAMSIEEPIGDPFGGPAYGEFNDPITATVGGSVASLGGAFTQANAAENAAHEQSQATQYGIDEQRRQFDLSRSDQLPFLQTGQDATIRLRDLIASGALTRPFQPGDLTSDPGYQFGLGEGNKAIENASRSRGMYMSPATVKELLRYGQDYAGTKYNDAFNRDLTNRTTQFNMLSGAAGGGQVAANTLTGAGQGAATNIGNLVTSGANARGAAGISAANAYGNAFNNIGNNAIQQSYLDRILKSGGANNGYFGAMGPYNQSQATLNSSMYGY